eukprot:TRINITY_DN65221_c0_g1_i1.p1 TRINITY_DN65221_c0_g1~~TRINITY_DN65221_c0_g1_i1.p1  ORF type:complete len:184 (+),score=40.85 TRINITY_DN65221_c0_g1_i1:90-641(+)
MSTVVAGAEKTGRTVVAGGAHRKWLVKVPSKHVMQRQASRDSVGSQRRDSKEIEIIDAWKLEQAKEYKREMMQRAGSKGSLNSESADDADLVDEGYGGYGGDGMVKSRGLKNKGGFARRRSTSSNRSTSSVDQVEVSQGEGGMRRSISSSSGRKDSLEPSTKHRSSSVVKREKRNLLTRITSI